VAITSSALFVLDRSTHDVVQQVPLLQIAFCSCLPGNRERFAYLCEDPIVRIQFCYVFSIKHDQEVCVCMCECVCVCCV
jgi:hypothetical protein